MSALTDELMANFKLGKVFHDCDTKITDLEFSYDGSCLLTASTDDESIHLYDAVEGKSRKLVYSKKYGVGTVKFTHRPNNVIYSSTKGDDIIRYLSLHDNAYLRYFSGHKSKVTALEMSPLADTFISGAANDSVRLWDLRSPDCEGMMACEGTPLVAIDPQGVVFAVALNSKHIRLFDMKNYRSGPFAVFEVEDQLSPDSKWTEIKFSPDGKDLLVNTNRGHIHLINSFDGVFKSTLSPTTNVDKQRHHFEASFTPDGKYVLCGAEDRKVHVWNRDQAQPIASFEGHSSTPTHVKFSPSKLMFASACTNLVYQSLNIYIHIHLGFMDSRVISAKLNILMY